MLNCKCNLRYISTALQYNMSFLLKEKNSHGTVTSGKMIIVRTGFDFSEVVDWFPSKAHLKISYPKRISRQVFPDLSPHAARDSTSPKPKMVWDRIKRNRKWSGTLMMYWRNIRTGLDMPQVNLMIFRIEYVEYVIIFRPRSGCF